VKAKWLKKALPGEMPGSFRLSAYLELLGFLLRELRAQLRPFALTQLLGAVVLGLSAAIPFALRDVVSQIQAGDLKALLWVPPAAFLLFLVIDSARTAQTYVATAVGIRMGKKLQRAVFTHLVFQDHLRQAELPLAEKNQRVMFDTQTVVQGLMALLSEAMLSPVLVLTYGVIMLATSWKLTLVGILVLPLYASLGWLISGRLKGASLRLRESQMQAARHVLAVLSGLMSVQVFRMEAIEIDRYQPHLDAMGERTQRTTVWSSVLALAMRAVSSLGACLVAWAAFAMLSLENGLSVPDLAKFTALLYLVQGEVARTVVAARTIVLASVGYERIRPLLDAGPRPAGTWELAGGFRNGLAASSVTFGYGPGGHVLVDASLEARRGEWVMVIGRSGAGKTTLANVLAGVLRPRSGSVTVDGTDVADIRAQDLKRTIGYVAQGCDIFDVTVRANIAYGRPDATREEVDRAARLACADAFINALPDGYETPVGEEGARLSEGQRRRLILARVLLLDTPILLLDEPYAGIDNATASVIVANLRALGTRTVVVFSHQREVFGNVDRIYELADGRLRPG